MKEILPRFQDRGRGHLVNIASSAGKGGFPGGATYCGTKHFVVGVSEAGARRAARHDRRGLVRHAGHRQHRARAGAVAGARRQEHQPTGRRRTRSSRSLKNPRFDVYVPKSDRPISKVMNLLPRAGREAVVRR
jgi:hypothetical protein